MYEMPCRGMFIQKASKRAGSYTYPFDHFVPVSALVRGKYNDYGWMEFDPDEEARLFETAAAIGVEGYKEEHEHVQLPDDTHFWMIREDTFQMLDSLPVETYADEPKTVGEDIARRMAMFEDLALQAVGLDPFQNWQFRDRIKQLFYGNEMPRMPIQKALIERDGRPEAVFDHVKLFSAMLALHKCLMPTQGGSQVFVTDTYIAFADFITKVSRDYMSDY